MLRRQFYCITCSAIATYAVLTNMIPLGYAQTPTENYTPYNPSLGSVQITVPWRAAHASGKKNKHLRVLLCRLCRSLCDPLWRCSRSE
ncbi:hypothetical protein J3Q64DRAFT_1761352 [Phycomyces blakesleeanus]|uniref:Secreted protein n=1 Tax=Phycomyces blakesleeanus TaxID=4837 RepID=A0ABR3AQ80_PHYBL